MSNVVDSAEGNLLYELTDVARTTVIDNGGCRFTIVERGSRIEAQHVCNGRGSEWVDVIGDSSAFKFAETPSTSKRQMRRVGSNREVEEKGRFRAGSTLLRSKTAGGSSKSSRPQPSELEEFEQTNQTSSTEMEDEEDESQSDSGSPSTEIACRPHAALALSRFGLMKKLTTQNERDTFAE